MATRLNGWMVYDNSFVANRADPTQVTKFILDKDDRSITLVECWGFWEVKVKEPGGGGANQFGFDETQVETFLASIGAPSIDQIEVGLGLRPSDEEIAADPTLEPGWHEALFESMACGFDTPDDPEGA